MRVHLASAENPEWSAILRDLRYPFRLASYLYLCRGGEDKVKTITEDSSDGSHWIMDSGLYTLMFGAEKSSNTMKTYDDYRDYALKYVERMVAWGWKHPIVECDVQKVLGVDECLRLREEVFAQYPGEVIYVWHIPEGVDGLRRLARERSYIALSVPEMRAVHRTPSAGGPLVKRALAELLAVIKQEGSPKVHLLGCTESELLRLPAYSADSTSWYSSGRFGTSYILERGHLKSVSAYSPKWDAWRRYVVGNPRWSEGFAAIRSRQEANRTPAAVEYFEGMGVGAATFHMLMDIVNG